MLGRIRNRSGAGRRHRRVAATATTFAILAMTAAAQASASEHLAPVDEAQSGGIANHYIVVLKGTLPARPTEASEHGVKDEDSSVASSVKAKPEFEYDADLKGFAADLTHQQVQELRHDGRVEFIEQDAHVHLFDTQNGATWGLTRIDERPLNLDGVYNYSSTAGRGVTEYIIDTGINTANVDFGSRASFGTNVVDRDNSDCNGHGTHVAGTVAGTKYGVAKRATLVGIKALNCGGSGTWAGIVQAMNWVAEHHVADKSVVNMSLGGGKSVAVNDATDQLVASGVFVSAAAGNNNQNACNFSPAGAPDAFTVAASDNADRKATFSNFGPCVDTYAPGVSITSDWIGSNTATNSISGTSMAAPHVAGVAALYLAEHASTPAGVATWITDHATTGVITGSPADTPNRLLYKGDL